MFKRLVLLSGGNFIYSVVLLIKCPERTVLIKRWILLTDVRCIMNVRIEMQGHWLTGCRNLISWPHFNNPLDFIYAIKIE